ncbi:imidazoleglycerol-phosphate dehydratase HisB [Candidatus Gottesmanbacteria bacterium]|nr:imidazoleglycerol-phosphate dehydratase HisB [Candidatus Gottesmanbacteria bacterium]
MKRTAKVERKTKETDIKIKLNIDGEGNYSIDTPIGFLNHMLELFVKHGLFDLEIVTKGDIKVDEHHTVEDIGIILGKVFAKALNDKKGINRYGFFILPMDESLITAACDLSGRIYFRLDCEFKREKVGDLPTELVYDFWDAFAKNANISLQIKEEFGRNDHHKIEGIFKSVARALHIACDFDERIKGQIPSTKGVL